MKISVSRLLTFVAILQSFQLLSQDIEVVRGRIGQTDSTYAFTAPFKIGQNNSYGDLSIVFKREAGADGLDTFSVHITSSFPFGCTMTYDGALTFFFNDKSWIRYDYHNEFGDQYCDVVKDYEGNPRIGTSNYWIKKSDFIGKKISSIEYKKHQGGIKYDSVFLENIDVIFKLLN
jgi:hypothetical protein